MRIVSNLRFIFYLSFLFPSINVIYIILIVFLTISFNQERSIIFSLQNSGYNTYLNIDKVPIYNLYPVLLRYGRCALILENIVFKCVPCSLNFLPSTPFLYHKLCLNHKNTLLKTEGFLLIFLEVISITHSNLLFTYILSYFN